MTQRMLPPWPYSSLAENNRIKPALQFQPPTILHSSNMYIVLHKRHYISTALALWHGTPTPLNVITGAFFVSFCCLLPTIHGDIFLKGSSVWDPKVVIYASSSPSFAHNPIFSWFISLPFFIHSMGWTDGMLWWKEVLTGTFLLSFYTGSSPAAEGVERRGRMIHAGCW